MSSQNLRKSERKRLLSMVRVGWQDRWGHDKAAHTQSFDISETGLRFELPEAVGLRSYVTLRSDKLTLNTRASVRFCGKQGNKFIIGVEFAGGFRWRPPNDAVRRALEESAALASN